MKRTKKNVEANQNDYSDYSHTKDPIINIMMTLPVVSNTCQVQLCSSTYSI